MSAQDGYAVIPLVAESYDQLESSRPRGDIPFFMEEARRSGGPVLELACGTGRVLMPTAQAGIEITGLDYSELMLAVCRRKIEADTAQVKSRVTFIKGDMCAFDLGRRFALITIPFNSFLHLIRTEDQLACLHCVNRHLAPGGRLILGIFHPHLPYLLDDSRRTWISTDSPVVLPDGRTVTRFWRAPHIDLPNQLITTESVYGVVHVDGHKEEIVHRFGLRYVFRWELEHMLARAGLEVETIYGDYQRAPFGATEPGMMITVARVMA